MQNQKNKEWMETWSVQSPEAPGYHAVVTPTEGGCKEAQVYRLNMVKGETFTLESKALEMNPVLIEGAAQLSGHPMFDQTMKQYDSFYIPGNHAVTITALEDCIFYVAAATCEGVGEPLFRAFDLSLPIGDIHQIHGTGVGQREVMFTFSHMDKGSKLICGLTWGGEGAWTSWPPHQHEKYLEEVYCYHHMDLPHFGFHVSYLKTGDVEDIVTHTVHSGTMVQAPAGYHPTVASPGVRNTYFWVLASFDQASRRYDLAQLDPALENFL